MPCPRRRILLCRRIWGPDLPLPRQTLQVWFLCFPFNAVTLGALHNRNLALLNIPCFEVSSLVTYVLEKLTQQLAVLFSSLEFRAVF